MKKLARILMITTTLSTGLGIGTIALYANNDGFKVFLDSMIDKYAGNEHPSEYAIAEVASTDYASSYHENQIVYNDMVSSYPDEDSSIQVTDLPEDYWQQSYNDTYGGQPGEASYENYIYDETSDIVAAYEATSEPESPDIQIQKDTSATEEPITTQTPAPTEQPPIEEEPEYIADNRFTGDPDVREMFVNHPVDEDTGLWNPCGYFSYEQIVAVNTAPWKAAGYTSLPEAWADFYCTQVSISTITGGTDFHQWCQNIVDGVGSKYDHYTQIIES